MRIATFIVITLLAGGCGATPAGAADPERSAVLAIGRDAQEGLRFQRMRLKTSELAPGLGRADLDVVAGNYRVLARRIASRSRPFSALRDIETASDRSVAYDAAMRAGKFASSMLLTGVVEEYQTAFKTAVAITNERIGRTTRPADVEPIPDVRVGIGRGASGQ